MPLQEARATARSEEALDRRYTCPDCGRDLKEEGQSLRCPYCSAVWRIDRGIPVFTRDDLDWTTVRRDLMGRLVNAVETGRHWRDAVLELADEIPEYTRRYILAEDRADFAFLLPLKRTWRVLDLGAGLGSVSVPLSRWVKEVFCGDPVRINCRFLKARAEQDRVENLHVFQANPLDRPRYPFRKGAFDLLVLNGVLEWTGNADLETPVRDLQARALSACYDLIADGGYLYLGIENRYAYGAFLGEAVHGELPFTGLLPRPLAGAYMRLFGKKAHRTYIHGMGGYRRLLGQAGFRRIDFHLPRPGYRDPFWLLPGGCSRGARIWARQLAGAPTRRRRLLRWWAGRLPVQRIWPSYAVLCRKEDRP